MGLSANLYPARGLKLLVLPVLIPIELILSANLYPARGLKQPI